LETHASCIEFTADGKSIVTGWTDGKVRAFTPQTGKLLYIVQQAHVVKLPTGTPLPATTEHYNVPQGVISLSTSRSSNGIITGGYDS
jgi:WD40 repeat protein